MEGHAGGTGVSGDDIRDGVGQRVRNGDDDVVEAVLRDLAEAADRWEALLEQAATITYSVDMGDLQAIANSDGKLIGLNVHPDALTTYSHHELAQRMNTAFQALREEAEDDHRARYGGTLQ